MEKQIEVSTMCSMATKLYCAILSVNGNCIRISLWYDRFSGAYEAALLFANTHNFSCQNLKNFYAKHKQELD